MGMKVVSTIFYIVLLMFGISLGLAIQSARDASIVNAARAEAQAYEDCIESKDQRCSVGNKHFKSRWEFVATGNPQYPKVVKDLFYKGNGKR